MKTNYCLILGVMLSTSLLAQTNTSAPIATPAAAPAATIAPADSATEIPPAKAPKKKAAKKKSAKTPEKSVAKKPAPKKDFAAELRSTPLVAGPATCVASNVNVRGQAKLKSEVVTRIQKGQTVTVLEEVVRNDSGPEEPSAWAKILLPPGGHVWVNTLFVTNGAVKPKKLNLRSGPGENYSVVGLLMAGDAVKEVTTKGDWIEIEAPASAYAFVAAQYLKQEPEAPVTIASTPVTPVPVVEPTHPTPPPAPEPAPEVAKVGAGPTVAPAPTDAPVPPPSPAPPAPVPVPPAPPETASTPGTPAIEPIPDEPPPPRIVQREGIVRGMTSIQAPSAFALINPDDKKNMDYLYTTSPSLDLRRYKGLRIIVTGEEGLDDRWPNTPVLTIQRIQVVEEAPGSGS